jgi:hypothetical protein
LQKVGHALQFARNANKQGGLSKSDTVPTGDLVGHLLRAARELPAEDLPDLIGQLEAAKAAAWARLTIPVAAPAVHDELLSAEVAAERLGVSKDYLYRHHSQYPFTRRQGRKVLFSALGIDKHIHQNKG